MWAANDIMKSSPSYDSRSRIFRVNTELSEESDEGREEEDEFAKVDEEPMMTVEMATGSQVKDEGKEAEEEEEVEEKDDEQLFYMEDRMSEVKSVNQLFANAFGILKNSKDFTNYPITLVSLEKLNKKEMSEGNTRNKGKEKVQ